MKRCLNNYSIFKHVVAISLEIRGTPSFSLWILFVYSHIRAASLSRSCFLLLTSALPPFFGLPYPAAFAFTTSPPFFCSSFAHAVRTTYAPSVPLRHLDASCAQFDVFGAGKEAATGAGRGRRMVEPAPQPTPNLATSLYPFLRPQPPSDSTSSSAPCRRRTRLSAHIGKGKWGC